MLHRHGDPAAFQQSLRLIKNIPCALIIFSPRSITINVVRDRIGIGFIDRPVDRSIRIDPDVPPAHIDQEEETAARTEVGTIKILGILAGIAVLARRDERHTAILADFSHLDPQHILFSIRKQIFFIIDDDLTIGTDCCRAQA